MNVKSIIFNKYNIIVSIIKDKIYFILNRYDFIFKKIDLIIKDIYLFYKKLDLKGDMIIYLPYIGWMYPIIFESDDDFKIYHTKQALLLALIFTCIPIVLTFSTVFIAKNYRIIWLLVVITIYLIHVSYFALCVWGAILIKNGKLAELPVISKYTKKIII